MVIPSNCQRFGFGDGADYHEVSGDSIAQKCAAKNSLHDLLNLHLFKSGL